MPTVFEIDALLKRLSTRGLFRCRDLTSAGVSVGYMDAYCRFTRVGRRGSRVWVAPGYQPTRYEILQVRIPRGVFTGPTALWLLGVIDVEPKELWLALNNNARIPRTLAPHTVIVRTRHLEGDVLLMQPHGQLTELRVHSAQRVLADLDARTARGLINASPWAAD